MRCALKYISIIMLQLSIGAVPIAKPIINLFAGQILLLYLVGIKPGPQVEPFL